jgi:predicted esterase YcpF (UPF0227 family)
MDVIKQKLPIVSSDPIDGRPVAIYVHGLASGAAGTTFCSLARKFKHYRWITTDFGETIENNVNLLNSLITQERPSLIVGTSMGGLTVLFADAPEVIKVVCNPALSIADCVRFKIGLGVHEYFCERIDGNPTFELTEEMCLNYEDYIAKHVPLLGKENYAIFSAHDELLGDEASLIAQQVVSDAGYNVLIDSKGVHRITSSTIKLIAKLINKE